MLIMPAACLEELDGLVLTRQMGAGRSSHTRYMTKACRTVTSDDWKKFARQRAFSIPVRYLGLSVKFDGLVSQTTKGREIPLQQSRPLLFELGQTCCC